MKLLPLAVLAGLFAAAAAPAQKPPKAPPLPPMVALATSGLAGQSVAVLPLTMVVSDPRLPGVGGAKARTATMRWADSLLADMLGERATEVTWIFPASLRRTAQRAAGLVPSPDQMGQSVMRSSGLREMPDPLRTYVRQLMALTGGARYAFIPAALYLSPASGDSLLVQLSAVLADSRLGRVVWRTVARGQGETAADALRAALATIIPPDGPSP